MKNKLLQLFMRSPYFFRLTFLSIILGMLVGVAMDAVMHNGELINAQTLGVRALPLDLITSPHPFGRDEASSIPTPIPQLTCSNGHDEGLLEGIYSSDNTFTGWRCTLDPENVCTAGSDGIFTSCTFPQQEHPWPGNVTTTVREQPPTPLPDLEDIAPVPFPSL